jgi:hypothetical protein
MKAVLAIPLAFFRLFYQSFYLALDQIWVNKTRSILATLGIVIGVASVTAVIAALTGLQAKILTQVETFGTTTIFMSPHRPDQGPMQNASWRQIRFRPEQFDHLLEHCPSVKVVSRTLYCGLNDRHLQMPLQTKAHGAHFFCLHHQDSLDIFAT